MPETPEQRARHAIDANLAAAGWLVRTRDCLDLTAGRGIAVCEFPLKSGFQPAMNKTVIEKITFPVPSQAEQEAIVEILEDQLSVIDHLEADIDAKLKAAQSLRQSILRHAFTGQLVPRDPTDEPAAELLKRHRR